jgi:hypothetical protein
MGENESEKETSARKKGQDDRTKRQRRVARKCAGRCRNRLGNGVFQGAYSGTQKSGVRDSQAGFVVILDRFPGCRAFAVPGVVEKMRLGSTPEYLAAFWNPRLPGKIADRIMLADPLPGHTIELEGHQLVAVELGHTEMDTTSCLHVPEIGLVVAGDAVYNDVHLHLSESDHEGRLDWLAALRTIESLHPKAVVAGHSSCPQAITGHRARQSAAAHRSREARTGTARPVQPASQAPRPGTEDRKS